MDETTVSLSNDSRLIDDIETTFKDVSILSGRIRNFLTTGVGGNPLPLYADFKKGFDFLFTLTSDHKDIRDKEILKSIETWLDCPEISSDEMWAGLKLFRAYKTQLFYSKLLRYV